MLILSPYLQKIKIRKDLKGLETFCIIRKKWLVSTPEELVRQAAIQFLIDQGYSIGHISVEKQVHVNKLIRRYDIVVSNKSGEIIILVECKQPDLPLQQKTIDQISVYNLSLKSRCLWVTNGHNSLVYLIDYQRSTFKEVNFLPLASDFV